MKKVIRLTESDLIRLVKRVIKEQASSDEKQISGPFFKKGQEAVKYFVYQKGGKFYIYMSNASQSTPKLFDGTIYNNNGVGYNTANDANQKINAIIAINPNKGMPSSPIKMPAYN
jgi:hypothetical protein